jgi:DNA-binding NtrC family response regulator
MALELSKQLTERSISNERLKPTAKLSQILRERSASVVILDYLLGDFGTALDILTELKSDNAVPSSKAVIWTDEPSVSVAIQAMKLGAVDYVEIGSPNSLEKVLEAIDRSLRDLGEAAPTQQNSRLAQNFEAPVGQNKAFQAALSVATSLAVRNQNIVVLLGATGTGRNTVARYIHSQRTHAGALIEVDFDLFPGELAEICGDKRLQLATPYLSHAATVMLDHVECDTGELLSTVEQQRARILGQHGAETPLLVVGTTVPETAQAWYRLAAAEIIELPTLSERVDDLLPLMQRFAAEAHPSGKAPRLRFSVPLLEHLTEQEWPGNVRQFRAAVIEAITAPAPAEDSDTDDNTNGGGSKLSRAETAFYRAAIAAKLRWERYQREQQVALPHAFAARRALDDAAGNFRIAAAHLGVTIPALRTAIGQIGKNAEKNTSAGQAREGVC